MKGMLEDVYESWRLRKIYMLIWVWLFGNLGICININIQI